jgi:hypothetical protein
MHSALASFVGQKLQIETKFEIHTKIGR